MAQARDEVEVTARMKQQFEEDGPVMFTCVFKKVNRYINKTMNFVAAGNNLYIFKGEEKKRAYSIA